MVQLIWMGLSSAVLPVIVHEDRGYRKSMFSIKRQHVVVEDGDSTFRQFSCMQKSKRVTAVRIDDRLQIEFAHY